MFRRPTFALGSAWLQLAVLALLTPLALFPTPDRFVAFLAIPGLWLCRWRLTKTRFIVRTPLDAPVLLLLLMVLVSLYAAYDIRASLPKIAGLVFGMVMYFAVVENLADSRALRWAVGLYLALGVLLAGLALVGTDWAPKSPAVAAWTARLPVVIRGLPGAEAGFHPNEVAGALLWFIPLAAGACAASLQQLKAARTQAGKPGEFAAGIFKFFAVFAGLLLMTGTLGLTQSRSAALGLAVAALTMLAGLGWRGRGLALAGLLLAGLALWRVSPGRISEWLFGGSSIEAIGPINLAGRVEVWSRALDAIRDFPVTGLGLNAFRGVAPVLYPMFLRDPARDIGHAHNQLLQVALDLGIPGLVAYLALLVGAAVLVMGARRRAREAWLRSAALGLAGSLVAFFVYGLTDAITLGARPGLAFWFLLALSVGVWRASSGKP